MTQQVDVVNELSPSKDDEVLEALHAVMHAFRSRQHRQLRDSVQEVGPMEIRALRFFARHPGATQRELVAHSGRDKGQIARLLASLRERGLLEARADEQDRRCTRLQLSPTGATLLDQARRSTAPLVAAATDGFSPTERQQLLALLQRMRAGLEALPAGDEGSERHASPQ